jgi:hypothetical protein
MSKSKSDVTALELVQEGIKQLQGIEKLIQDAKVSADPKARKRGMPRPTALLRITDAILRTDYLTLTPLSEWAKHEDFWTRFERNKARREKRKRK